MKKLNKKDNKDYFGLIFITTLVTAFLIGVAVITISLHLYNDLSWKESLLGGLVLSVCSLLLWVLGAPRR